MESNKLEQIEKLHTLKEQGILSQEEFEKSKREILNDTCSPTPQIPIQNSPAQAFANTNCINNTKKYSKKTTLLLCLFLGGFGAHRFYTGFTALGVVYIFTIGILGIAPLVDLILILSNNYKDCNGNSLIEK